MKFSLILVMQCGTVPHELVMESIQTFGERVLPEFAPSDAEASLGARPGA